MIIEQTGGPEVFRYAEIATPVPAAGEVLVQIAYAGVNPADWKNREGHLAQYRPYVFPYIIGFDAAGRVAAVGEGAAKGVTRIFSTMDDTGCAATLEKIAGLLASGAIVLPRLQEYALRDVAAAHSVLQRGHNRGKMVLKVADFD